jgi:hypothetical protein
MAKYPANFTVDYPERLSRWKVVVKYLFGSIYAGIPHGIILFFLGIAVSVITFVAFWIILFTGKYPRGLYDFVVGYMRWSQRVNTYLYLLRDEYPPFTTEQ